LFFISKDNNHLIKAINSSDFFLNVKVVHFIFSFIFPNIIFFKSQDKFILSQDKFSIFNFHIKSSLFVYGLNLLGAFGIDAKIDD
jgi:hypothetical protein